MQLKAILTATALAGALATSGVALADHDRRDRDRDDVTSAERLDVVGTARLRSGRGVATFQLTSGQRRDGLQLATSAGAVRLLSIDLTYSDGRVERLRGPNLRAAFDDASLVTIQHGRPPGLRTVEVRYQLARGQRAARLHLMQLHTGDGYTKEEDKYRGDSKFDSHDIDAPGRPWRRR